MLVAVVLLVAASAAVAAAAAVVPSRSMREQLLDPTPEMAASLKVLNAVFSPQPHLAQAGVEARAGSVRCAACTIAVSEVWGQLQENRTVSDIQAVLKKDLCDLLPGEAGAACTEFADKLPEIAKKLESMEDVSTVCMEFGFCAHSYVPRKDPEPVYHTTVDLDAAPEKRWAHLCSNATLMSGVRYVIDTLRGVLPGGGKDLGEVGSYLHSRFPAEYAAEISGCAAAAGGEISVGWMSLFNLGYEVSDACTSTVVNESATGLPLHGRNLDFFTGGGFTDSLKGSAMQVDFVSTVSGAKKTLYTTSTFPGFVGALSAAKPGVASVTIDTRFQKAGITFIFAEALRYIEEHNAHLVSFLARTAVATADSWEHAVGLLSTSPLIADVYYTTAGAKRCQGAVISRAPLNATNTWLMCSPQALTSPTGLFILETNYDHWKPAPWFDDRRDPGIKHVREVPAGKMNRDSLFKVMSTKPTLNSQTVWTNVISPSSGYYETMQRWCNLDTGCVQ